MQTLNHVLNILTDFFDSSDDIDHISLEIKELSLQLEDIRSSKVKPVFGQIQKFDQNINPLLEPNRLRLKSLENKLEEKKKKQKELIDKCFDLRDKLETIINQTNPHHDRKKT